jgi:hypothetical protein
MPRDGSVLDLFSERENESLKSRLRRSHALERETPC